MQKCKYYWKCSFSTQPFLCPFVQASISRSVCKTMDARCPIKWRLKCVSRADGNATKSPVLSGMTRPASYKHRSPPTWSPSTRTTQIVLSFLSRCASVATLRFTTRERKGWTIDCAFPGSTSASILRMLYSFGRAALSCCALLGTGRHHK